VALEKPLEESEANAEPSEGSAAMGKPLEGNEANDEASEDSEALGKLQEEVVDSVKPSGGRGF